MSRNDDTAIDAGGPSKQFLSDVWLQMKSLAVEVLTKDELKTFSTKNVNPDPVVIFEEAIAGDNRKGVRELIPLSDDAIVQRINNNLTQVGISKDISEFEVFVERAKERVRLYSRAIGRFLV